MCPSFIEKHLVVILKTSGSTLGFCGQRRKWTSTLPVCPDSAEKTFSYWKWWKMSKQLNVSSPAKQSSYSCRMNKKRLNGFKSQLCCSPLCLNFEQLPGPTWPVYLPLHASRGNNDKSRRCLLMISGDCFSSLVKAVFIVPFAHFAGVFED